MRRDCLAPVLLLSHVVLASANAATRIPTGFVAGGDLLVGMAIPSKNPVGGEGGLTPTLQAQLRLGHELGQGGRLGRLEGSLASLVSHPSGVASWGLDSTYALQGYVAAKYTSPLLRVVTLSAGLGYGGSFAVGRPPPGTGAAQPLILPSLADGHGPVLSGGFDVGIRMIGVVAEVVHLFDVPGNFGSITHLLMGLRFGR